MNYKDLSITFHTPKVEECKKFYEKYFGAKITFDCGWYATVHLEKAINPYIFISFMAPQEEGGKVSEGGITLNMMIEDVDAEYERLKKTDIKIALEIADQPWGDRSFRVEDPIGNMLYIYSMRPVSDEYKDAVK